MKLTISLATVLCIALAGILFLGAPAFSADEDPLYIGEGGENWVYTAVNPCRIFDTRVASKWGTLPITGGTARTFKVRGNVEDQNGGLVAGNAITCPSPGGEPRAVHVNITATDHSQNGNLQVAPASVGLPGSAWMSFTASTNISNIGTVKNNFGPGNPNDIQVFASTTTHVVGDVLGYYYDVPVLIDDDFAQGLGVEPFGDSNWRFVAPVATVTVTGPGQKIFVTSNQTFTCNIPGADCDNLDIAICSQIGASFTLEGPVIQDVFTENDNRKLVGLSAILAKPPGTYDVALCAKTEDFAWDAPTGGQTSALVLSY